MTNPPRPWAPAALLLLLGFVWGSSFILMKLGLFARDGSPLLAPLDLATLRIFVAGTVLLPVSLKHLHKVTRKDWGPLMVVGSVGSLIPAILFATAQKSIPSALAGMLNALSPLWTLLIAVVVFKVQVQRRQVAGLVIGFVGALVLVASEGLGASQFSWASALPAMLLIAATLGYGVSVNTVREKLGGLRSYVISALSLGIVAVPAGIWVAAGSEVPRLVMEHPDGLRGLTAIVALAAVGTAGALVLFNQLIQWTNALVAASVTYIIPVFATLWGVWDGEEIGLGQITAGIIILIGVSVTNRKKR